MSEQVSAKRNVGKKETALGRGEFTLLGPDACIQLEQLRGRQLRLGRHETPEHVETGRIVEIGSQVFKAGDDLGIVQRCFHGHEQLFQRPVQNPVDFNYGLVLSGLGIQQRLLVGGDLTFPAKNLISALLRRYQLANGPGSD